MKKSQKDMIRDIEDVCRRNFTVSAYTGMTGQIEAQKRQAEAIIACVKNRGYLFKEDA